MEQQPQNTPRIDAPKRSWLVMYFVIVVAAFIAVGGTGAGVYYLQQGQIDQLAAENEKMYKSHLAVTESARTIFKEEQAPFTFAHPSDWSVRMTEPAEPSSTRLVISLAAASSLITDTNEPIGPTTQTKKAAHIQVRYATTNLKNIEDQFNDAIYKGVKDKKNVTVAGQPGVEYLFGYEGETRLYTDFIKDGLLYSISFAAEGDEAASKHLADYKALVSSFTF